MKCPRCNASDCKEISRSNDNIDNLSHSHMACNNCGYHFNHWHESEARLEEVFGDIWETYTKMRQ